MKKIIAIILCIISCLCLFSGCSKQIDNINDFSRFQTMTQDGTEKIDVTFDNHSGKPFYFSITDKDEIEQIMDILFSAKFKNIGREPWAGDNTSIKVIQGQNEYNIHFNINKERRNYYGFTSNDLQEKIIEIARRVGAYEGVE